MNRFVQKFFLKTVVIKAQSCKLSFHLSIQTCFAIWENSRLKNNQRNMMLLLLVQVQVAAW
ncbi:MAG TPA: hypothetical protein VET23_09715, partial [Chitinophagaceae bacterium]|nr:hypothetical protein [Chitinophagaceae bacterium]